MRQDDGPSARAIAYFGSSFPVRVMVEMSFRAMRLLHTNMYQMRFCEDEATARKWIETQRAELLQQTRR